MSNLIEGSKEATFQLNFLPFLTLTFFWNGHLIRILVFEMHDLGVTLGMTLEVTFGVTLEVTLRVILRIRTVGVAPCVATRSIFLWLRTEAWPITLPLVVPNEN